MRFRVEGEMGWNGLLGTFGVACRWAYCLVKCKIVWLDDIFVCVMALRHDRHRFCRRLE